MKIIEKATDEKKLEKISKKLKHIDKDLLKHLLESELSEELIEALVSKTISDNGFESASLVNLNDAANMILSYAKNNNGLIYIFGDYDSDGLNSTYILNNSLLNIIEHITGSTCEILYYVPERTEGYGLNMYFCDSIIDIKNETGRDVLVVTVDNGITKHEEVAHLKNNGIEVVITDHHEPQEGLTPENVLIVDPHLHESYEGYHGLCGASIVYRLISYMFNDLCNETSGFSQYYLVNAMIATITDMMPLTKENIYLVRRGLELLNANFATVPCIYYKDYVAKEITAKDIAFEIGPYLNACGRMGKVELGMDFLNSDDEIVDEKFSEMVMLNDKRKNIGKKVIKYINENMFELFNDKVVVIFMDSDIFQKIMKKDDNVLTGICGPIANQIMNKVNRPVIFLHGDGDIVHGSARSCLDIDLQDLFKKAEEANIIEGFGGHKYAAGVSLKKENIANFRTFLNDILFDVNFKGLLPSEIEIHKTATLSEICKHTFDKYSSIAYFSTLQEPVFAFKDLTVHGIKKSSNNPKNICFKVSDSSLEPGKTKSIWAWDFADKFVDELNSKKNITIIGNIVVDFMSRKSFTVNVIDIL